MKDKDSRPGPLRFAGAGFELACFSLLLAGIGYWVDHYFGFARPWGMLAGGLLGFSAGMLRIVLLAIEANR